MSNETETDERERERERERNRLIYTFAQEAIIGDQRATSNGNSKLGQK